jgi:hypothetical protein
MECFRRPLPTVAEQTAPRGATAFQAARDHQAGDHKPSDASAAHRPVNVPCHCLLPCGPAEEVRPWTSPTRSLSSFSRLRSGVSHSARSHPTCTPAACPRPPCQTIHFRPFWPITKSTLFPVEQVVKTIVRRHDDRFQWRPRTGQKRGFHGRGTPFQRGPIERTIRKISFLSPWPAGFAARVSDATVGSPSRRPAR